MNVSSTSKDPNINDSKSKIGFNAGVFANFPLSSKFTIQPELLYTQYGNKTTFTTTNQNTPGYTVSGKNTGSTSLDYIALPVMFQYKATPQFYLEAGPEFGLLINAKNKYDLNVTYTPTSGPVTTTSTSGTSDVKDNINSFNLGLGAGAGYYFTPNIGITARYVAGVTKINKYHIANSSDNVINSVFQVGLAYKFAK